MDVLIMMAGLIGLVLLVIAGCFGLARLRKGPTEG